MIPGALNTDNSIAAHSQCGIGIGLAKADGTTKTSICCKF